MNFFIKVNNRQVEAIKGESILDTLQRNGIQIPTLCKLKGFAPTGACRLCVVEVSGREELIPSCSQPVEEWMEVFTHTPRVIKARKVIIELLLSNHPDDCLYCERNNHCELQDLANDMNIRERRHSGSKNIKKRDLSSPSLIRDPEKCILCGRCVNVCEEIAGCNTLDFAGKGSASTISTTLDRGLNISSCITCGQCVLVCPTGALYEKKNFNRIQDEIYNKDRTSIAITETSAIQSVSEAFGFKDIQIGSQYLNAALRKIGFNKVYPLNFANDLYISLLTKELIEQVDSGEEKTIYSSNCPAFVKYTEQFIPEILPQISNIKSPPQLMGSIIKMENICEEEDCENPFVFSISSCLARKFESQREEYAHKDIVEVDHVISSRGIEQFIKLHGISTQQLDTEEFDPACNISSGSASLLSIAGGTLEAVIRQFYHVRFEKDPDETKLKKLRTNKDVRTLELKINKKTYRFAAINGMKAAADFIQQNRNSGVHYHFIEVMACPMGCINGGGQPIKETDLKAKAKAIYDSCDKNILKVAAKNMSVREVLDNLEKKDEKELEDLIYTSYKERKVI